MLLTFSRERHSKMTLHSQKQNPMLMELPQEEQTELPLQHEPSEKPEVSPLNQLPNPPPKKRGRKSLQEEAEQRGVSLETLRLERQATKTGSKTRVLPSDPREALVVTAPYKQQAGSIVRFLGRILDVFGHKLEEEEKSEGVFAISALLYEQSISLGAWGLVGVWAAGIVTRIGLEMRRNKALKKTEVEALQQKIEALPHAA
jgi:hypothetical protein